MKKTLLTLFILVGCGLALAAGQYPDQSQSNPQTTPSSSSMGKSVTFIGCLQSGTEPNSYVLSNAMPSDMSRQATRSEGMPSEMARTENSYRLIPEGKVDLKKHVGHKVEVTGKMAKKSSMTSMSKEQPSEMTGHLQHFKVTSVREIAQSCQ